MEATETTNDGSIESAIESIIAPIEEKVEETVAEEAQVTEVETEEVEAIAESETEETIDLEEDLEEVEEISATDESDEDNDQVEDAGYEELERFAVKIDGQEVQVTLDDLKQGYSGQKYVQQGMQEAAKQKKEAEEVFTALNNERAQMAQLFQELQQGNITSPPVAPSRELLESDPIGYLQEQAVYEDSQKAYNAQMAQLQEVSNRNSEAEKNAKQVYLKQEMSRLQDLIPEFADANKAGKLKERLVNVGQNHYGYSANEISQITDHRAIQVLNDAVKYRAIMAGKDKAVAKTRKAKPIIKAGNKRVADSGKKVRNRQQAKLKQSGSIEDALGLILNT